MRRLGWIPRFARACVQLTVLLAAIGCWTPTVGAQGLPYRLQGEGASLRMEGSVKQPVSERFMLLSATAHRMEQTNAVPENFRAVFFAPRRIQAHVLVRALEPRKSYQMKAVNTLWDAGWSTFGPWPGDDVEKSDLLPENLGITVTESEFPDDSGIVYPAILLSGRAQLPDAFTHYTFTIKSGTGLAPLRWNLYEEISPNELKRVEAASGHVERLPPAEPHNVVIPASFLAEGMYRLRFVGDVKQGGHYEKVRKHFIFYHRPTTGR